MAECQNGITDGSRKILASGWKFAEFRCYSRGVRVDRLILWLLGGESSAFDSVVSLLFDSIMFLRFTKCMDICQMREIFAELIDFGFYRFSV